MGLDPNLLNSLPDTLVEMYGAVEADILKDMARRISTYDYFIPAALHQNQKLQELGMVQKDIIKKLSSITGQTQQELVDLLSMATAEAVEDDVEYYTRAEVYEPSKVNTEALHKQLNSGLLQTEQSFFNITKTTVNTASKQFEKALDRAWTQINTGGMDYQTAIRKAITYLSDAGIGSIEYSNGRTDNIEVAVRRAVVTGANQTAIKTQEVLADELGVDLVEVTAHGGARPSHAKWQGKVYSRNGRKEIDGVVYEDLKKATGYGRADGLCGINCRHAFHPYVHGTERAYSGKDLKALDKKKIKYNGKTYTEYEASQIQRRIEREIRKQKRTVEALKAAGQDASAERKLLREAQKSYTDFTEQTGIRKQSARVQIGSAKAEREVRKANVTAKTTNDVLTNTNNDDKIKLNSQAEMYRRKDYTHRKIADDGGRVIAEAEYNKLVKKAKKDGANVIRGDDFHEERLRKNNKRASIVGDTIFLLKDCTISDVLEETYHLHQNKIGMNNDKDSTLRMILNEIDAQNYLLSQTEKYNIPIEEVNLTKTNLHYYEMLLEKYKKEWE